jgi:hypothetical protein
VLPVLALAKHLASVFQLLGVELALAPEFHAAFAGRCDAGAGPLGYQAPFQFREYAYHLPHGAARGRISVNVFREGTEFHAPMFQVVEHGYQVAQAAAQPVEFPDYERVAALKFLQTTDQGRAIANGSRQAIIPEHFFATRLFQRGEL